MQLIYPAGNVTVMIPREIDGSQSKLVFQAAHRNAGAVIFWHLDGEYLGATRHEHNLAANPLPGKRQLVLVDENGYRVQQSFTIALGSD
jgi:penicillin-binding protein 1C